MARPRIGVCTAFERARWGVWDREVFLTPHSYVDRVHEAGGMALLLPIDEQWERDPDQILDLVDGVLLCGGSDIDPSLYGQEPHECTVGTSPRRDQFEIAIARAAIERDMPVLGICRGMQLLNVALGGTLIQHLPDDVGHGDHRRSLGSFDNADHPVRLAEDSLAAKVIGELEHKTYSHHHQGIDRLGAGLVASGWATIDELVETIELPDKRFVLGVQWHPEVDGGSPVVAALVEAAAGVTV